jgi:hypothetical protein
MHTCMNSAKGLLLADCAAKALMLASIPQMNVS